MCNLHKTLNKMSCEDDLETYLKRLQTNRENRENLAEKCWCGSHREGARLVMAWKALTSGSSTRKFLQRERRDAQFSTTRYLKVTVLRKLKCQAPHFFWP